MTTEHVKKPRIEKEVNEDDFEVELVKSDQRFCCEKCKHYIDHGMTEYGINFYKPTSMQKLCAYRLVLSCVKSVYKDYVRLNGTAGTGKTLTTMIALKELLKIPDNKLYLYMQNSVVKSIDSGYDWDVVVFVPSEALIYQWALNLLRFNFLFLKEKQFAIYISDNEIKPFNCIAENDSTDAYKILICRSSKFESIERGFSVKIAVWDDCYLLCRTSDLVSATYIIGLDVRRSRHKSVDIHLPCSLFVHPPLHYDCIFNSDDNLRQIFEEAKKKNDLEMFLQKCFLNVSAKTQKEFLNKCYKEDMQVVLVSGKKESDKNELLKILQNNYEAALHAVENCLVCTKDDEDCSILRSTECCKKSLCSNCFVELTERKMTCPFCRSITWNLKSKKSKIGALLWLLDRLYKTNVKIIIGFTASNFEEMREISQLIEKNDKRYQLLYDSRQFNETKRAAILLCTRHMVGVNIVECDSIIIYGLGFTHVELVQIIGRAVRSSNKRQVSIVSLKPTNEEIEKEIEIKASPFSIKLTYKPQKTTQKLLNEIKLQVTNLFRDISYRKDLLLRDFETNTDSCLLHFIKHRPKYTFLDKMILQKRDVEFLKEFRCITSQRVWTLLETNEENLEPVFTFDSSQQCLINKCCIVDNKKSDFEMFLSSELYVFKKDEKRIIVDKGLSKQYGINHEVVEDAIPFFVYATPEDLYRIKYNHTNSHRAFKQYKWKILILVVENVDQEKNELIAKKNWLNYAQYVFVTQEIKII